MPFGHAELDDVARDPMGEAGGDFEHQRVRRR
jgi:hypothetical protein